MEWVRGSAEEDEAPAVEVDYEREFGGGGGGGGTENANGGGVGAAEAAVLEKDGGAGIVVGGRDGGDRGMTSEGAIWVGDDM